MLASHLNLKPEICVFAEFSMTHIFGAVEAMFDNMEDHQFAPFDPLSTEQFLRPTHSEHSQQLLRSIWMQVYPHKRSSRILANKLPALTSGEDIDYLINNIPSLKVVYMLRNCPKTVASAMVRGSSFEDIAKGWLIVEEGDAVREWVYSLLIAKYLAKRGASILFVKYEELVERPESEAARLAHFLGVENIEFSIAKGSQSDGSMPTSLKSYPNDILELVSRWSAMSAEEIIEFDISSTINFLTSQWQPLRQPLCDIGTLTNFHIPEPWGVWSRPGYASISPRFFDRNKELSGVEIVFKHNLEALSSGNVTVLISGLKADVRLRSEIAGQTIVTATLALPMRPDTLKFDVFSSKKFVSSLDRRELGLAMLKYRVVYVG